MKSINDFLTTQKKQDKWDNKLSKLCRKWMAAPASRNIPTFKDIIGQAEWDAMPITREEVMNNWYDSWSLKHDWDYDDIDAVPSPVWRAIECLFMDACNNLNVIKITMKTGGSYIIRDVKNEKEYSLYIQENGYGTPMYRVEFGNNGMIWGGDDITIDIENIMEIVEW